MKVVLNAALKTSSLSDLTEWEAWDHKQDTTNMSSGSPISCFNFCDKSIEMYVCDLLKNVCDINKKNREKS